MKNLTSAATAAFLSMSAALALGQAQKIETSWLELVKGFKGSEVGAQMREVETDAKTGEKTLSISIPKAAIAHPRQMEEVIVVGQMPKKREPFIDVDYEFEWVDDYDKDNYGLVIRLGKDSNWPIRLYMQADDGLRN
ncbi:MAG: hypothetical protein ACJAUG_000067 [Halioglobus sp.]|jgi:hypothetical protein